MKVKVNGEARWRWSAWYRCDQHKESCAFWALILKKVIHYRPSGPCLDCCRPARNFDISLCSFISASSFCSCAIWLACLLGAFHVRVGCLYAGAWKPDPMACCGCAAGRFGVLYWDIGWTWCIFTVCRTLKWSFWEDPQSSTSLSTTTVAEQLS